MKLGTGRWGEGKGVSGVPVMAKQRGREWGAGREEVSYKKV